MSQGSSILRHPEAGMPQEEKVGMQAWVVMTALVVKIFVT